MKTVTPLQYCYPYFFDQDKFGHELRSRGLNYKMEVDEKTKTFRPLEIFGVEDFKLSVYYFSMLMFDSEGNLLIWKSDYDTIILSKVIFGGDRISKIDFEIDLKQYCTGKSKLSINYGLRDFVAYVRLNELSYDLEYFEKFAIIIINADAINIIPFDWFNKTGGDYGYVWPATAQIDFNENELFGKGMRMADFRIKIAL